MGTSLGCCPSIIDEPDFQEYCIAHSSAVYQPYLKEVVGTKGVLVCLW